MSACSHQGLRPDLISLGPVGAPVAPVSLEDVKPRRHNVGQYVAPLRRTEGFLSRRSKGLPPDGPWTAREAVGCHYVVLGAPGKFFGPIRSGKTLGQRREPGASRLPRPVTHCPSSGLSSHVSVPARGRDDGRARSSRVNRIPRRARDGRRPASLPPFSTPRGPSTLPEPLPSSGL